MLEPPFRPPETPGRIARGIDTSVIPASAPHLSLSLSLSLSRPWFSSRAAPPHTFPILMHPRRIHIPHSCCLVPGKYFLARAYNLRVYPRGSEFSRMHKRYSFACPHRSFTVSRDITASPFIRDGTNPRSCLFITRVRVHADS